MHNGVIEVRNHSDQPKPATWAYTAWAHIAWAYTAWAYTAWAHIAWAHTARAHTARAHTAGTKSRGVLIQVSNDSSTVLVYDITRQQLGDYYCYFRTDGATNTTRYRRYVLTYYERTLWVIYERNFLTGGVLAGGFLVVIVTLCLIDAYRWRPKPTAVSNYHHTSIYQMTNAHANLGFDGDVGADRIRLPRFDVAMPVPDYATNEKPSHKALTSSTGEGVTTM